MRQTNNVKKENRERLYDKFSSLFNTTHIKNEDLKSFYRFYFDNKIPGVYDEFEFLFDMGSCYQKKFDDNLLTINLLNTISLLLPKVKKYLNKITNNIIDKSIESNVNIFKCFDVLNNTNKNEIKNDIIYIFLSNQFLETQTSLLDNVEEQYSLILKTILHVYLDDKSDLVINNVFIDDSLNIENDRLKFFDKILKICQMKDISSKSFSKNNTRANISMLGDTILGEMFKTVNVVVDKQLINEIETEFPLVYLLLSSYHIENETSFFKEHELFELNKKVSNVVYFLLRDYFNDNVADIASKKVANEINSLLKNKSFIDINKLSYTKINFTKFKQEFPDFTKFLIMKSLNQ